MSLQLAAQHIASQGRGGDSVLVHMSPMEVMALQKLAEKHGTSLTINPKTGQPEALSLKSLLPMIAGAALNYFVPGLGMAIGEGLGMAAGAASTGAIGTGIAVGGFEAARTGDFGRGVAAGLGAYGGASLGAGVSELGSSTIANESVTPLASGADKAAVEQYAKDFLSAKQAVPASEAFSQGIKQAVSNPGQFAGTMGGPLATGKAALYAAVPTLTEMPEAPGPVKQKGYYRGSSYDPYSGQYTYYDPIPLNAAGGGIMSAADLVYENDPVVRMADGGIADQQAKDWFAANPNATFADALKAGASVGASASDVASAWSKFAPDTVTGPTTQDIQSAYRAGDYGTAQQLGNIAGWSPQDYVTDLGLNRAQAQNLAQAVGYKGDLSGLDFSSQISPLAYSFYGGVTDQSSANAANRVSATDLAQWMRNTGYTGSDIQAAFAANPDFAKAGATAEQLRTLGITPTLSRASQWQMEHGGSFSPIDKSIDDWIRNNAALIASNPAAARAKGAADAAASGVNEFDVYMATGKTLDQIFAEKLKDKTTTVTSTGGGGGGGTGAATDDWTATTPATYAPPGTTNPYGNGVTPGDITRNPDGTITVQPNIPGRPYGGFTGIGQVKDAFTAGGGSLGQSNLFVPKNIEEFQRRYTNTGSSKEIYDYLNAKGQYPTKPLTATGEIMKPYAESVLGIPAETNAAGQDTSKRYIFDTKTRKYTENPFFKPFVFDPTAPGLTVRGMSIAEGQDWLAQNKDAKDADIYSSLVTQGKMSLAQLAKLFNISLDAATKRFKPTSDSTKTAVTQDYSGGAGGGGDAGAAGGLMAAYAGGGMSGANYNLGDYSDGGRLLRGPGDGVSDSIPATIANKRPARLADGEFVVPARIVSELGNGSTEAGARKLYAMMDRVQAGRKKSIGKGKVAVDSRADKNLPA